jgi:hypothetical protein
LHRTEITQRHNQEIVQSAPLKKMELPGTFNAGGSKTSELEDS